MDIHFLVASLFVPGIFAQIQAKGQCPPLAKFYYNFDWVLQDHVLDTYKVRNEEFCYARCISDQLCRSINYQIKTDAADKEHQCEINYSTKNRHPGSMKPRLGWVYEEMEGADSLPALDSVIVTVKPSLMWAEEGQTATLVCITAGQTAPTITWSKVDGGLGSNSQKDGKLTLSRVELESKGTYRCEAKNVVDTKTATAKIKVVPLPQFSVTPPKLVTVASQSHIQLNCQATFRSTVTWQRQGGTLPRGHKINFNGTLVLLNVSDESAGVYVCKASTRFRSVNTTTQVKVTYRSCSHLKAAFPSKISDNYAIDPDGEGGENSFIAYCDMVDKNGIGVTVISHDMENRERVTDCDSPGCLEKNVTYTNVTITQLSILTRAASHCEQFIMFECKNEIKFVAEKAAWWLSRDRKPMYYWGGAISYSRKCACGMTNTCVGGGRCNCKNYGPGGWRNDSGLLTDRSSLPVVQLTIGNVGNSMERDGYYTLGKFKCYGIISITGSVTVSAPASLTAIFLDNVTLSCKATGHPTPLVTWRRKDEQTMDGDWTFLDGNLTLIQVSLEEQGTYVCEDKSGINTATTETNLVVMKFTVTPPVLVTAPEKAWIQLDCQTNINSTVTWRRRGGDLPREHLYFPNGTLLLRKAKSSFSGFYICAVKIVTIEVLTKTQVLSGNLSCSHIKAGYPGAPSGNYTIDPDSEGGKDPFVVYCDMSDTNIIGVTVVGHDREERSHVKNCNTPGCYSPNVTYLGTTLPQLTNLVKVSTHCEQFIMLECNGSVAFIGENASWWLSRDRKPMLHWGGAVAGSKKCACGTTSTCDGGGVCNCKTYGPREWRNDSGLLTDRSSLPVTQLAFGSMSGKSYYTLKTFKCYGTVTVTAVPVPHPCKTNPCRNGGTCKELGGNKFQCTCTSGYRGVTCDEFSVFVRGLEKSSIIGKNREYVRILEGWLKTTPHGDHADWVRCYEAILNGWNSKTFHHNCDNRGPSVVIVKSQVGEHEYFFGGYNTIGWTGDGYIRDTNGFLFSLKNKDNLQPFIMRQYQYYQYSYCSYSGYGPTFGGGHDLHIASNAGHNHYSYTNLGNTYRPPNGFLYRHKNRRELLAGLYHFSPVNYEVFVTSDEFFAFTRGLEKSSIIGKNREYLRTLDGWLKTAPHGDNVYWVRCYEAILNGWSSHTFHHNCDNRRPSVVIVKSQVGEHEYFFGGYNSIGWKGNGYIQDTNGFLFSLKNKDNLQPFIMRQYRYYQYSYKSNSRYGPTFGGGHDLYIANNAGHNRYSYTNLGNTYLPPNGFSYRHQNTRELLAGLYKFSPVNYEVFVMSDEFFFFVRGLEKSSIIGKKHEYLRTLDRWLKTALHGDRIDWVRCYEAMLDGWSSQTFHQHCDNRGPSVVIVKSQVGGHEYFFGGFNSIGWKGNGYIRDTNGFLFSLKNKDILRPFVMRQYRYQQNSYYSNSRYGPTFGGGHDLCIANNAGHNRYSYTNLGHTYRLPGGYSYGQANTRAFLAGLYHFTPLNYEVFVAVHKP